MALFRKHMRIYKFASAILRDCLGKMGYCFCQHDIFNFLRIMRSGTIEASSNVFQLSTNFVIVDLGHKYI